MYSAGESEVLTGRFLREFCQREEVAIATKLYVRLSDEEIRQLEAACEPHPVLGHA